jgi:hypothetical protein
MSVEGFIGVITSIGGVIKDVVNDDGVKGFLNGTYSDGTPRNYQDARRGEYLSPKQKKKMSKKKKKKKKNRYRL